MIDRFENVARVAPTREFLSAIDETGKEQTFTYREARLISAAIALRLRQRGVGRSSYVAIDLPNGPEFVFLMLAAAYGPFPLVLLESSLSAAEKSARLRALSDAGVRVHCVIDQTRAEALQTWAEVLLAEGEDAAEDVDDGFQARLYGDMVGGETRDAREIRDSSGRDARGFGARSARDARPTALEYSATARGAAKPHEGSPTTKRPPRDRHRPIFSEQQDALDDVVHFAEQVHRSFDKSAPALVLFSTTTSARPRPLTLRWFQLESVANAAARALGERGDSLSQVVMPLAGIQGISLLIRAIIAGHGLRLYRRYDPDRVLWDAVMFKVTHLSLGGAMLKSLLAADTAGALRGLDCLLVDGRALKPTLAERALDAHLPLYVGFGCPETAGLAAVSRLRAEDNGGLAPLDGVKIRVLERDESGYGSLSLAGPGLFSGYLSGKTPFTIDGFFLTGDRAALVDGMLFVRERASEVYQCGGELVSLEEIERVLAHVPGVWDVHVMDVRDETLGRRPVALLERAPGIGAELTINSLRPIVSQCFTPMTMPKHLCFTDELPTDRNGLVDGMRAEGLYRRRIEIKTVKILRPQPNELRVVVSDDAGRSGVGEISFRRASADGEIVASRAPESSMSGNKSAPMDDENTELAVLRSLLAPMVVREAFLHPREVAAAIRTLPHAANGRHAAAALERACWDLYAAIVGRPLELILEEEYARLVGADNEDLIPGSDDLVATVLTSDLGIESALARLVAQS